MRKICPRCRGRGYLGDYARFISLSTSGSIALGPGPRRCWRCDGLGLVEVWDGYQQEVDHA